jgi:cytochrome P450
MPHDDTGASPRCPIDFDHESREHAANWPQEFRELRASCPRGWSTNYGGYWVATRYQDIVDINQRPESFTAHKDYDPMTGAVSGGLSIPPLPGLRGLPNESEGKEWEGVRSLLNRRFSPKAVEAYRPRARELTAALVDLVIEAGDFDIVEDLTNPLPALMMMEFFGFALGEWRRFADPFHKLMYTHGGHPDYAAALQGLDYFRRRVDEEMEQRRKAPRDDLLGYLARAEIDGAPIPYEQLQAITFNLMVGGVDTTTSLTSNVLLHLSRNPDHRRRLMEEPALIPYAREEFVRYFTPIHGLARNAKEDVAFDGWQFKKGDRVWLAYASANRDPDIFENAEEVILDRLPNRHIGFGAGMHRCLGSFLARMMFEVMLDEVLRRMPGYAVQEDQVEPYPSVAKVNGWIRMPATFPPGPKVGAVIG